MSKKVIVIGGSGLLGRAIAHYLDLFEESGPTPCVVKFEVQRWVFTRQTHIDDKKVDIANRDEVFQAVEGYKPDAIIHCAAIRAPDIVDNQREFSQTINVLGSQYIAQAAAKIGAKLIYISTDYVFDGKNPPYAEDATPNPLNEYGKQKLAGEEVTIKNCPGSIILRVPILYGPVHFLGEGAVDVLLKSILQTNVKCEMSDYERRFPTHVNDVAAVARLLLEKHFQDPNSSNIQGVYHWSGSEEMTKWDMAKAMAEVFSLPIDHLVKNSNPPPAGQATKRPYNSNLSCKRLLDLGAANRYNFKTGLKMSLENFVQPPPPQV